MRTVQTLPRLGVIGVLLLALAGAAIFGASRAEALPVPDIEVTVVGGPFIFPSDNALGEVHFRVMNVGSVGTTSKIKVNFFEASMWPASVESVSIANSNTLTGVTCTHLSNINEKCVIDHLGPGDWIEFSVNMRTQNLGSAPSATGILKAKAATVTNEFFTDNNAAKTKYSVFET